MFIEVLLTQDEMNAILSALHTEIANCYQAVEEDRETVDYYRKSLLDARSVLLDANSAGRV